MNILKESIPSIPFLTTTKTRLKLRILLRDNFECQYCPERITIHNSELTYVQPLTRGGKDNVHNLKSVCKKCALEKSNKSEKEFLFARHLKKHKNFYEYQMVS